MARKVDEMVEAVVKVVKAAAPNLGSVELEKIEKAVRENLPDKVYSVAAWGLAIVTGMLAIGSMFLAYHLVGDGKLVPEGIWVALGAGLGGLAGIFTGNK